jgi:hypothetical protein
VGLAIDASTSNAISFTGRISVASGQMRLSRTFAPSRTRRSVRSRIGRASSGPAGAPKDEASRIIRGSLGASKGQAHPPGFDLVNAKLRTFRVLRKTGAIVDPISIGPAFDYGAVMSESSWDESLAALDAQYLVLLTLFVSGTRVSDARGFPANNLVVGEPTICPSRFEAETMAREWATIRRRIRSERPTTFRPNPNHASSTRNGRKREPARRAPRLGFREDFPQRAIG